MSGFAIAMTKLNVTQRLIFYIVFNFNLQLAISNQPMSHNENRIHFKSDELRDIIDAEADSIIRINDDGIVEIFNRSAQNLFGYKENEVLGKSINILMLEKNSELYTTHLEELKKYGQSGAFENNREVIAKTKDGRKFPVETSITISQYEGKFSFIAIIRDISGRKLAEERISQYMERLEWAHFEVQNARVDVKRANQAKSAFLANMSHEIRTPLNGILGMTELLLNTELTEKQKRYATNIYSSGEMLLELVNDILDVSKIEAGGMRLEAISCNLRNLVDEVMIMLKPKIMEKPLKVNTNIHKDVPKTIIMDPVRIKQILLNLIGNAVKFTAQGHVSVTISAKESLANKVKLYFEIEDTGIGIDKSKQSSIFKEFEQGDLSTTRKFGGTGLGLTICKQLVEELMYGKIGVESEPGKGSLFWFEITVEVGK